MDISAGGLAPSSRDGNAAAAAADPFQDLMSPLGSPVFANDQNSQSTLPAVQGDSQTGSTEQQSAIGAVQKPLQLPARRKSTTRVYGSKGVKKPKTALDPSTSDATPRPISRSGQRYFDNPPSSGKGAPSQAALQANRFYSRPEATAGQPGGFASDSVPLSGDNPPGATPALKFYGGSPPKPSEGAAGGPSQSAVSGGDDALSTSEGQSRRFGLTEVRKIAQLDRFANEEESTPTAPEGGNDDRLEGLSEFSFAVTASGYAATDDGMTVRSGYKRAFSEIEEAEEEDGEAARFRFRRSDTPFNESEFPEDEAASFASGSRFTGRRHRSRSVAFSQRSLFSERSGDEDEDGLVEQAAQDSGFYGVGEQSDSKGVAGEPGATFETETGSRNGDGPYIDALTPIHVLYSSAKHPFLAYAAALAQAAEGGEATKEADTSQLQQTDQENVDPAATAAEQKVGGPAETSVAILAKWEIAQKGAAGQFGDLVARVDKLLQNKVTRHGELRSTLHSHASNLNERFMQLEQTKKGLRDWGGQLFGGYMTGLEPHGQGGSDGPGAVQEEKKQDSATSPLPSKAPETAGGGLPASEGDLQETAVTEVVPDSSEEA